MIYTRLTNEAMRIAYAAHHGQVDKGNVPYILHPVHLAEQMDDEFSTCVALLHDVVEDTSVTLDALAKVFPDEVIQAISILTHTKDEPYLEYIARIKDNPIALKVKLADLRHNSDETRLPNADEATLRYYREKYKNAFAILTEQGDLPWVT